MKYVQLEIYPKGEESFTTDIPFCMIPKKGDIIWLDKYGKCIVDNVILSLQISTPWYVVECTPL